MFEMQHKCSANAEQSKSKFLLRPIKGRCCYKVGSKVGNKEISVCVKQNKVNFVLIIYALKRLVVDAAELRVPDPIGGYSCTSTIYLWPDACLYYSDSGLVQGCLEAEDKVDSLTMCDVLGWENWCTADEVCH